MNYSATIEFARSLDEQDPLQSYRERFCIPIVNGVECIYFGGNSLGLMPTTTPVAIKKELDVWAASGVFAQHARWEAYHEKLTNSTARIVGAKPSEVVVMNALTVNLHLLLVSFYQPTADRYKIAIERGMFPSDQYAVESQIKFHGLDPQTALVELTPRAGEKCLRTADILKVLAEHGDTIATILIGNVQYYTGQAFDMEKITAAGQENGAYVGFNLAHGVGNLLFNLHDLNVDFAAWCNYKYLCSGPGGPGGIFVHERHQNWTGPRLAGWWGHDKATRFEMKPNFVPIPGAEGWQISNAPILAMASLGQALDIFDEVGMPALRKKSVALTGYLEYLINLMGEKVAIITPSDPLQRGCQLSLVIKENGKKIYNKLGELGVVCDWREPDVIRITPVPLYNSYTNVFQFYQILDSLIH